MLDKSADGLFTYLLTFVNLLIFNAALTRQIAWSNRRCYKSRNIFVEFDVDLVVNDPFLVSIFYFSWD